MSRRLRVDGTAIMKVAIVPACFYPPKAYFDLIGDVDHCVLSSDGEYVKHRFNRTLLADNRWLTLPVRRPERRSRILFAEAKVWTEAGWHEKLVERIREVYDPLAFERTQVYRDFLKLPGVGDNLSHCLRQTVFSILSSFRIATRLSSSDEYAAAAQRGQRRVIRTCKEIGATEYVHPAWSRRQYDAVAFHRQGLKLSIYKPKNNSPLSVLDDCFDKSGT